MKFREVLDFFLFTVTAFFVFQRAGFEGCREEADFVRNSVLRLMICRGIFSFIIKLLKIRTWYLLGFGLPCRVSIIAYLVELSLELMSGTGLGILVSVSDLLEQKVTVLKELNRVGTFGNKEPLLRKLFGVIVEKGGLLGLELTLFKEGSNAFLVGVARTATLPN